uniref:ACYPI008147 protein n=1 Tax=Acyrthosiphon pisum TaxID=7029 RepID=C4WRJ6_ACYPI|nr:ACYPI008147 [Acyrthosiphon pisum]
MGRKFPVATSFLGFPLKTGAIISGVYGIVIAIVTLLIILISDIRIQTIVIDFLPKAVVQIIVAINLLMTVLISVLLLVGIFRRKKILMLPWIVLTIMLCIGTSHICDIHFY